MNGKTFYLLTSAVEEDRILSLRGHTRIAHVTAAMANMRVMLRAIRRRIILEGVAR